jgi:hypothetical protein
MYIAPYIIRGNVREGCTHNEKNGQYNIYNLMSHEKIKNCNLFIMSIIHGTPVDACC